MIKDVVDLTSQDFSKGLNTIQDIFKLAREETPNAMNVKFDFDGKMLKRLGTNTRNNVSLSQSSGTIGVTTAGWTLFDFGTRTGTTDIRGSVCRELHSWCLTAALPNLQTTKCNITFSDGYLGSRNDEERSEMRYVM